MTDEDMIIFKPWLIGILKSGKVEVTFTKKDGEQRVMQCTLSEELIPKVEVPHLTGTDNPIDFPKEKTPVELKLEELLKDKPKKVRKVNEDILPVYDLVMKAWRSFRWDSVISIKADL